jgi:hypothetical protein
VYRLTPELTQQLVNQPESGMGYQVVEAHRANNTIERGIAHNAELLVLESEPPTDLKGASHEQLLSLAKSSANDILKVTVVPAKSALRAGDPNSGTAVNAGPASGDVPKPTGAGETFQRFSAYLNDRRLAPNNSWVPGTYATTSADASNINTGMDAVRRYALPPASPTSPALPASYTFSCAPVAGTLIQRGIVVAANGQPGGGVEVIFPKGTNPASVFQTGHIPDN